jgi:hypothetical protein
MTAFLLVHSMSQNVIILLCTSAPDKSCRVHSSFQLCKFWVVTPSSDVVGCHHFGGSCYIHLHITSPWIQLVVFWVLTPHQYTFSEMSWIFVAVKISSIALHPEHGDRMVLRNVGILPHRYAVSQPRTWLERLLSYFFGVIYRSRFPIWRK